jgi:hypothetical protein
VVEKSRERHRTRECDDFTRFESWLGPKYHASHGGPHPDQLVKDIRGDASKNGREVDLEEPVQQRGCPLSKSHKTVKH